MRIVQGLPPGELGRIAIGRGYVNMRLASAVAILLAALLGVGNVVHAQGNADDGEDIFRRCRACHDIGAGAKNKVGRP